MSIPQPNRLKRALAAGERQIGFWLTLASPNSTEIAAGAGFDWLLIDMEHSPNDLNDVIHQLRAAVGGTAEPVVRIPWNDPVQVKRLLDIGVRSLMFPYVQSVEEAKRAVASTRYPTAGIRGVAGTTRATNYGRIKDYGKIAADDMCVIVQLETTQAIAAATEIAKVDGVDCLFIGPNDLSASMGHLGNTGAPAAQEQIAQGLANIKAAGKAASGILEFKEDAAKKYLAAGFQMIAVGGDGGMLARGTEAMVKSYKG